MDNKANRAKYLFENVGDGYIADNHVILSA